VTAKYRVEYFDIADNTWQMSSTHRNKDYAVVNMAVLIQGGKAARVICDGKIVAEGEK
jgi:hypothetical protein